MLDRCKLLKELQDISQQLFVDNSPALEKAAEIWLKISQDSTFIHKVRAVQHQAPWLIPNWQDQLNQTISISSRLEKYCVVSVDGSQIYPDRHQGTACFLINIGVTMLAYGLPIKSFEFNCNPYVYTGADQELELSTELVNCQRQEHELTTAIVYCNQYRRALDADTPFVFLFDGSLIFWHLESKEVDLKAYFLQRYLNSLENLYQSKTLLAGYISLPKNKELINLIKLDLCNFNWQATELFKDVDCLVDTTIAHLYLQPHTRSIIFKNNAKICQAYPAHLQPHFFYINVGNEIGRVEIPGWIAQEAHLADLIASIVIDQSIKGNGYPVAIAESHEQAVVKGPDREFFYQLINKIGFGQNRRLVASQKSIKKRGMGV